MTAPSGMPPPSERTMCALTMNDNVFVLLDDPFAPSRGEFLMSIAQDPSQPAQHVEDPPHYRSTFLTLRPPGALEQLLALLRARWISTRQSAPGASQNRKPPGPQLIIEGHIFAIGNDWIVRAGNVVLAGGTIKGMILEVRAIQRNSFRSVLISIHRLSTSQSLP